jgi:hypothetical protein
LFNDPHLPFAEQAMKAFEFGPWSNHMILGDILAVMNGQLRGDNPDSVRVRTLGEARRTTHLPGLWVTASEALPAASLRGKSDRFGRQL